jgi:hypothetical protein
MTSYLLQQMIFHLFFFLKSKQQVVCHLKRKTITHPDTWAWVVRPTCLTLFSRGPEQWTTQARPARWSLFFFIHWLFFINFSSFLIVFIVLCFDFFKKIQFCFSVSRNIFIKEKLLHIRSFKYIFFSNYFIRYLNF